MSAWIGPRIAAHAFRTCLRIFLLTFDIGFERLKLVDLCLGRLLPQQVLPVAGCF